MGVLGRLKLLLVEDDEDTRALLAELLEDDFEVSVAGDAQAGLAQFERDPPDVLVTDESLPGMRGTALAREVKRRHPGARVVLVSGYVHPEGTEWCDLVLKKPVDVESLSRMLTDIALGQATASHP